MASGAISGGLLQDAGNLSITGTVTWSGGTIADTDSVTVAGGGQLNINGSAPKVLDDTTLNISDSGTVLWTGTGDLGVYNGAVINNLMNGTFTVTNNQSFTTNGAVGTFNNAGTFRKQIGSGPTTVNLIFNNTDTGSVLIDNNGTLVLADGGTSTGSFTVTAAAGTLQFSQGTYRLLTGSSVSGPGSVVFSGGSTDIAGTYSVTGTTSLTSDNGPEVNFLSNANSGAFVNGGGTVTIAAGLTLTVNGNYTQTAGTTDLDGATLLATNVSIGRNSVLVASGTITVNSGSGTLTNDGELDLGGPDTPGTLTVNGNYMQTVNGALTIKVGGTNAGTDFDQLNISGTASLNGSLTVRLIDNFSPATGSMFQILTSGGTRSGQFANANLGGRFLAPHYDPNDVTLEAS